MIKRGIRSQHYYATNVMPDVTEADLLKRLKGEWKLDLEPRDGPVFAIKWAFGSKDEREEFAVLPGDFLTLREAEAQTFARDNRESGGVIFLDPDDPDEVRPKTIQALRAVLKLCRDNGFSCVRRMMRDAKRDFSALSEYKYDYWPLILNEMKADVITAEIKRIERGAE